MTQWGPEMATERLSPAYIFPVDHPDLPKCAGVRTPQHDPDTCEQRGKHPCVKWSVESVGSPREAVALFAGATRNYGINCGRSRLLVLDEDVPGVIERYAAERGVEIPPTFTVRTGRPGGGRHYYFRVPQNHQLPPGSWRFPKGVDVKQGRGYVVGPGSMHASGQRYEPENDLQPAECPQWVFDVFEPAPQVTEQGEAASPVDVPAAITAVLAESTDQVDRSERFHHLVGLCRRHGLSQAQAIAVLAPWCERAGKYADRVAAEVQRSWPKVDPPAMHAGVDDEGESDSKRKPSQATILVKLAREQFRFVNGDDGRPYAQARTGPGVARPLRGANGLRKFLARLYADEHGGTAPSQSALADALNVLEGYAADADPEPVYLRVAPYRDGIAIDLGTADGRCVLVDRRDWVIVERAPVLFRRTNLTAPMPDPVRGGSLDPLLDLINADHDRWQTLVGWLVAALIPNMPHPVLALFGEQGTAKSTATKLLMQLVDPSTAPLRSPPRDIRQWAVTANASWTVALDNVSDVPAWLSDLLCKAVTGDGHVDRALYSDDDVAVLRFRRVLAINGISLGALKGDLADRFLPVELQVITGAARRGDEEVIAAAAAAYPAALGALLDLLVDVLAALPDVRLSELPRMADFARVLAAVDQVQGWNTLKTYLDAFNGLAETVVNSDQFAECLARFMDDLTGPWSGDASTLLAAMPVPDPKPRDWPKTGQAVGGRIRRAAPALRQLGYTVEPDKKDPVTRRAMYGLGPRANSDQRESAQPASEASEASKPQVSGSKVPNGEASEALWTSGPDDSPKVATGEASPSLTRTFEASEASEGSSAPSIQAQCCGTRAAAGAPVVPACQLCPSSPTYYRRNQA